MTLVLIKYLSNTTREEVETAGHEGWGGVCVLCNMLKNIKDKWIINLGIFYYPGGLKKKGQNQEKS